MLPYKRTLPATKQLSYAGVVKEDTIDLPRDYVLQRVFIDIRGDIDLSTATIVEDAGQKLISQIQLNLTGNYAGNKTTIDISGVDLYFINFYDYHDGLERVIPTGNGTNQAVSFQLCIDFRLAKNDPDDWSVGVPLYDTSSATLKVVWVDLATGYASAGGSNCALTGKITLFEGKPQSSDEFEAAKKNPIYSLVSKEFTCDTNTTSKEERHSDIATGDLLRRMWIMSKTSAGARSDTEFDKIQLRKIDMTYFEETDWDAFGLEDESDYSLSNYDGNRHIKGLIVIDFARGPFDEAGRIFGEDLTKLKSGDMKLDIWKNNASSKLRYIFESIVGKGK